MKAHLTDLLFSIVNKMTSELTQSQIVIERPKSIDHGDLSSNIALVIAKALKKSPRTVAQEIVEKIPSTSSFSKIEIAGAGFLNFYFSSNTHNKIINDALENNKNYGRSNQGSRKKIQIEFVSANPTGPLHVGHGRGAAIGDCLARLFEFSGWDVTREFYYNDAGSQIDNLTKSIKARCMNVLPEDPSFPEDGYRGEYISDIAKAYLAKKTIQHGSENFSSNADTTDDDAIKNYGVHYLRKEQIQLR